MMFNNNLYRKNYKNNSVSKNDFKVKVLFYLFYFCFFMISILLCNNFILRTNSNTLSLSKGTEYELCVFSEDGCGVEHFSQNEISYNFFAQSLSDEEKTNECSYVKYSKGDTRVNIILNFVNYPNVEPSFSTSFISETVSKFDSELNEYYEKVSQHYLTINIDYIVCTAPLSYNEYKAKTRSDYTIENNIFTNSISMCLDENGNEKTLNFDNYQLRINVFGGQSSSWNTFLWPHAYFSNGLILLMQDRINTGTVCHEMMHTFDLPDLYAYTGSQYFAVGYLDILGDSSTNNNLIAYFKEKTGWIKSSDYSDNVITPMEILNSQDINGQDLIIYPSFTSDSSKTIAYKFGSNINSSEFFVVEYRVKNYETKFDTRLQKNCSMVIYRVNTNANGNSNANKDNGQAEIVFMGNQLISVNTSTYINSCEITSGSYGVSDNFYFTYSSNKGKSNLFNGEILPYKLTIKELNSEYATFTLECTKTYNVEASSTGDGELSFSNKSLKWNENCILSWETNKNVTEIMLDGNLVGYKELISYNQKGYFLISNITSNHIVSVKFDTFSEDSLRCFNPCNFGDEIWSSTPPYNLKLYDFTFDGWWTAKTGGRQIFDKNNNLTEGNTFDVVTTYYAHWKNNEKTVLIEDLYIETNTIYVDSLKNNNIEIDWNDYGINYDSQNYKIKLNNATIIPSGDYGIYVSEKINALTIETQDFNQIGNTNNNSEIEENYSAYYGIFGNNKIIFTGSGTLAIYNFVFGIESNDLEINNGNIFVESDSYGFNSSNQIIIDDGYIKIKHIKDYAIYSNEIFIYGGKIEISGKNLLKAETELFLSNNDKKLYLLDNSLQNNNEIVLIDSTKNAIIYFKNKINISCSNIDKVYDNKQIEINCIIVALPQTNINFELDEFVIKYFQTFDDGKNWEELSFIPKNVGKYKLVISICDENPSYVGSNEFYFLITKANAKINNLKIEDWTYSETSSIPTAEINFGKIKYTYSNKENGVYSTVIPTNAGKYYLKATIEDTDNYNGTEEIITFNINKKFIENVDVILEKDSYIYSGSEICPSLTIKNGNMIFTNSVDYELEYSNNILVGDATITINFKGNYCGNVTKSFEICNKNLVSDTINNEDSSKNLVEIWAEDCFSSNIFLKVKILDTKSCEEDKTIIDNYKKYHKKYEKVAYVCDISLFDNETEIQPYQIKDDNEVTLKIYIPKNLLKKDFYIFHVHSEEDIEKITKDKIASIGTYTIDEDGYLITKINKLSEFVFIYESQNHYIYFLLLFMILDIAFLIILSIKKIRKIEKIVVYIILLLLLICSIILFKNKIYALFFILNIALILLLFLYVLLKFILIKSNNKGLN